MEFLSPAEWQTEVLTVHQHPAMSRNLVSAACKERNIRCMIVKYKPSFWKCYIFFKIWNKFNMIQIPRKMEPIFSKENPGNRVLRKIVAYVFLTVPWVKVQNFQNPELMKFIFYNLQYLYLQNINISSLNGLLSLDKL